MFNLARHFFAREEASNSTGTVTRVKRVAMPNKRTPTIATFWPKAALPAEARMIPKMTSHGPKLEPIFAAGTMNERSHMGK